MSSSHTHTHTDRLLALVIGRLCQSMPKETRDLLLFPLLLQPLLRQQIPPLGGQEWKEEEVGQALDDLHVILTAAPVLPALVECLAVPELVNPLLELWIFANRASAKGAAEAKTILLTLLRGADNAHKLLVDGYLSLMVMGEGDRPRFVFGPGGSGGIALRRHEGDDVAAADGADPAKAAASGPSSLSCIVEVSTYCD